MVSEHPPPNTMYASPREHHSAFISSTAEQMSATLLFDEYDRQYVIPLNAKINNFNFHPLEVVSRYTTSSSG